MVEDKGCFLRHDFWRIKGAIRLCGLKRDIVGLHFRRVKNDIIKWLADKKTQ